MEHREETTTLISSEKVAGTDVYNTAGESLGEVHDVMIDKVSGRVAYAVMAFGGLLGISPSALVLADLRHRQGRVRRQPVT